MEIKDWLGLVPEHVLDEGITVRQLQIVAALAEAKPGTRLTDGWIVGRLGCTLFGAQRAMSTFDERWVPSMSGWVKS